METSLIAALKEICSGDDAAALVTIIRVQGSTPRKAGVKMLVRTNGQISGTIGGGCGEAEVRQEALQVIHILQPAKYTLNMTRELAAEEGMVCGGIMEMLIEVIHPGQNRQKTLLRRYLESLEKNESPVLITAINTKETRADKVYITSSDELHGSLGDGLTEQSVRRLAQNHKNNGTPALITEGQFQFFIEPVQPVIKLLILGGGHIAQPLCAMAGILGYETTVIDDRPQFANHERFPGAGLVICDDFLRGLVKIELTDDTYIVIVTRGHRHDKLCLKAVINKPVAYIGMIGSKRRVKALMLEMIEEGTSQAAADNVHSPIGLKIGAQTPEEIAISILAEIISVHRCSLQQEEVKYDAQSKNSRVCGPGSLP